MDPLDKLDLILTSKIKRMKKDLHRSVNAGINPSYVYLNGVQMEIEGLETAITFLHEIKRNAPSMDDEIVLKMYGSDNNQTLLPGHKYR
jgi:hypothetical protein